MSNTMPMLFILRDKENNCFSVQAPNLEKAIDTISLHALERMNDEQLSILKAWGIPFELMKVFWKKTIKNVQAIPSSLITSPLPFKHLTYGNHNYA